MSPLKTFVCATLFLCSTNPVSTQPLPATEATDSPHPPFLTRILLAPLTFLNFCYGSYTFIKRDKSARDLVSNSIEIDAYTIDIAALKKNNRTLLRSKKHTEAVCTSMSARKTIDACMTEIAKLPEDLMLIIKPSILIDSGPHYTLKVFTTTPGDAKQLKKDLTDVFFVPEHETLTRTKKIAAGIAPVGLAGLIVLFVLL